MTGASWIVYLSHFISAQEQPENYVPCYWTYREVITVCRSGVCGTSEILAHDLQDRLVRHYMDNTAPPIEEVYWLIGSKSRKELMESAKFCYGLVVSALLLAAECELSVGTPEAASAYYHIALELLSITPLIEVHIRMFPIAAASDRFLRTLASIPLPPPPLSTSRPREIQLIITRCLSSLDWLTDLVHFFSEVYIYDKCNSSMVITAPTITHVHYKTYTCDELDGLMTGECSGYLTHMIENFKNLKDYVVFLHDDAPKHLHLPYLRMALTAATRMDSIGFLHLNHERYMSMTSPCLEDVSRLLFGPEDDTGGLLSTYCCSQFLVAKDLITQRGLEFYEKALEALRTGWKDTRCQTGHMPCYAMEFLWHKVFTGNASLLKREMDPSLPVGLRIEQGRGLGSVVSRDISVYESMHSGGYHRLMRCVIAH